MINKVAALFKFAPNANSLCRLYDNSFVLASHCSVGIAPIQVYTPLFPLNKQLASILLYQD